MKTESLYHWQQEWFGNIRADILAGLVVALALIPEAIAFSIIAGVDPKVGLYASFSSAVIVSITGGRPGMISAATAATAVLMVTLVKDINFEAQISYFLAKAYPIVRYPKDPMQNYQWPSLAIFSEVQIHEAKVRKIGLGHRAPGNGCRV